MILLCLWVSALTVPSFVTILKVEENVLLVVNNEEEQQEQSKTDAEEKQIICKLLSANSLSMKRQRFNTFAYSLGLHGNPAQEIISPPPEFTI